MNAKSLYETLSQRPAEKRFGGVKKNLSSMLGSDSHPDRLLQARRGAQTNVATGRRIAFVSPHGGSGTTSLMVAVGQALAFARGGSVALASLTEPATLQWSTPADADKRGIVLHPQPTSAHGVDLAELSRSHQVLLVDCQREVQAALDLMPHVIVIVGRNTVRGAEAVSYLHGALTEFQPALVTALRHIDDSGAPTPKASANGGSTVLIPHDRHIAGEARISLELCAENTRIAVEEIAASLMKIGAHR